MQKPWYIAIAVSVLSTPVQAQSPGAFLSNPTVRLWYEETGRLSDNIAPPREFILWNTIIGEGDAEEHSDDALFTIEVRSDGEQTLKGPLTMIATDSSGKVLARRSFDHLLTGDAGGITLPLWVPDVGCAGTVKFVAAMGQSSRSVTLSFDCGE